MERGMHARDIAWKYILSVAGRMSTRTRNKFFAARCDIKYNAPGSKSVCLTFDDGPHPVHTPLILEHLSRFQTRATFFCVGKNARKYPHLVRAIRDAGHEIGNHTMTHPDLHRLSSQRANLEITACQTVLQDIVGASIRSFRAPFGRFRSELRKPERFGLRHLAAWDVAPKWSETNPSSYSDFVLRFTKPGSIILLHDDLVGANPHLASAAVRAVADALPTIILALKAQNIPFQTISEQFSDHAERQSVETAS